MDVVDVAGEGTRNGWFRGKPEAREGAMPSAEAWLRQTGMIEKVLETRERIVDNDFVGWLYKYTDASESVSYEKKIKKNTLMASRLDLRWPRDISPDPKNGCVILSCPYS
jgi:hypothetical protein